MIVNDRRIPLRLVAGGLTILVVALSLAACRPSPGIGRLTTVESDRIRTHLEILASEDNARMAGWPGEEAAALYIAKEMESYGLQVDSATFPMKAFRSGPVSVVIDNPGSREIPARSFLYGSASPPKGITGLLVDGGLGRPEDLEGRQDIAGQILLIKRGEIWFSEKAVNAARAGAAAVVIYNNQPGSMIGVLLNPPDIPVVGIDDETGEKYAALLAENQELSITVKADTDIVPSESRNVIGRCSGTGIDGPIIVLGAHLDSVDTPGANNNASGLAVLLETARLLVDTGRDSSDNTDYRFVAFGSEEIGLLGSAAYVKSLSTNERGRFGGAIILDTVGTGDVLLIGTSDDSAESERLARRAESLAADAGLSPRLEHIAASDHASFSRSGLPAIILISTPYEGIHSDADVLESINFERTTAIASLTAALAEDLARGY